MPGQEDFRQKSHAEDAGHQIDSADISREKDARKRGDKKRGEELSGVQGGREQRHHCRGGFAAGFY